MSIADRTLPGFDHLILTTRPHIEVLPDDKLDWRPHEKSWTLGELASHIVNLVSWTGITLGQDELDLAPVGGEPPRSPQYESSAALLKALDDHAAGARQVIQDTSDEEFGKDWTLLIGGEPRLSLPKIAVLRAFVMDHIIHHRGQLTVYLRLLDVPVQQTFGPTFDFPDM